MFLCACCVLYFSFHFSFGIGKIIFITYILDFTQGYHTVVPNGTFNEMTCTLFSTILSLLMELIDE